jgi:F-type H+-transporting ATPase subunit b
MRGEESKVEGAPDPLRTPAGETMRWVNFLIVFVALGYVIMKKGGPAFRARANEIAAGITSAAAAKAEADAQLRVAEAGLARLDQDTAAMREEAKEEFAAESERLRAAGVQDVARIETAAAAEISAARRAAQIELRAMAARLAAARAAELVPAQITPAQRAVLVKQFVDDLPATSEGRGTN